MLCSHHRALLWHRCLRALQLMYQAFASGDTTALVSFLLWGMAGRSVFVKLWRFLKKKAEERIEKKEGRKWTQRTMDRLSSLPDHIICQILSYLPSKDAVATSILSHQWRYLWASVPVLDFDASLHREVHPLNDPDADRKSEICFQNFVSGVVFLHDVSVTKFRLIYQCYDRSAPIQLWFQEAISRNIQELEVDLCLSVRRELVQLPRELFTSNSLHVLKLSHMPLNVPSIVCFPRLKILELRGIMYLNDRCMQNLLSGCQTLEELVIDEIAREKAKVVNISMHKLRRFSFTSGLVIDPMVDRPYKFIINTPNLEYFHVKGRISDSFVVENLITLKVAHVDLRQRGVPAENYSICHQNVLNLLKRLGNVQLLTLSTEIVQLLCEGYDQSLPRFPNLKELAFGIGFDLCWKWLLTEFIKCSPFLEVLNLNNKLYMARDIDQLSKAPFIAVPENTLSYLKGILLSELYANFMPESVEYLMDYVTTLKKLEMNCRCQDLLMSQIGLP